MALSRLTVWSAGNVLTATALNAEFDNLVAGIVTSGGVLPVTYAIGDLLTANSTTTMTTLADVAVGSYLRSGGVGATPLWSTLLLPNAATTGDLPYASSTNTVSMLADVATGNALLSGGVGVAPSYGKIGLTTHITGTLAEANGGTGLTSLFGTANTWTANQTISNTAPSLAFTDTTASAKSLTVAVDANLAQLRESAGASGSLLVLDLANNIVGIGTGSPGALLHLNAGANNGVRLDNGTVKVILYNTGNNSGSIGTVSNHPMLMFTNNAERMRIDSSGNVGIGMTPTVQLELSGSVGQKASGTTWSNPSDARLKDNVQDYTDGLAVLRKVRPVRYELNGLAGTPKGQRGISIIAQEMLDVMPYTIETYKAKLYPEDVKETELYRFEASALTFALVNAVKELAARVEAMEHGKPGVQ